MLQKLQKRNKDQGFTIIEVMIVLAIAGLIMLIIFLAVPALQRTARNTQRKNDASAVASAYANFLDDNNGAIPSGLGIDANDPVSTLDLCTLGGAVTPTGGDTTACGAGNIETAKLGFYTAKEVTLNGAGTASETEASVSAMIIDEGYGCDTAGNAATATATPRTAAILYATETSSTAIANQCLEQ
ncbi:MAG TPA: type II secretion system protein [Candidatus Binatia bacterium]|nr:type II secretion system protein [Candidatus Binatia bacterium]